ncbi:MAG: hypothetical protein KDA69_09370 [Planctomycetaceae bacterium]|nr:hypothetical protein [Planctomycetaceae bacterium]
MWCASCETDVATELSADGQSLKCVTCGHEIRRVFAPTLHPETQSARDLLERWAREDQQSISEPAAESTTKPTAEPKSNPVAPPAAASKPAPAQSNVDDSKQPESESPAVRRGQPQKPFRPPVKLRVDEGHNSPAPKQARPTVPPKPTIAMGAGAGEARPEETRSQTPEANDIPVAANPPAVEQPKAAEEDRKSRLRLRVDAGHSNDHVPAPHVDVQPFATRPGARPGRAESLWGQLLAYAGVGGITVGSVLVVWGYFGGIESYASTGWLVATAGQMLLLLGVVTLISGGMTQTTHEVGTRIDTLDGRIHRIEKSTTRLLKGPHFARKRRRSRQNAERRNDAESA